MLTMKMQTQRMYAWIQNELGYAIKGKDTFLAFACHKQLRRGIPLQCHRTPALIQTKAAMQMCVCRLNSCMFTVLPDAM